MDNRKKLKRFVDFLENAVAPTNVASSANIAGLSPDIPPVNQNKKPILLKRKKAHKKEDKK